MADQPSFSSSQTSQKPRVALGLSGGVDSAVSAHLLVEAGYDVTAVYLECWRAPGCRTEQDRKDALAVALDLEIPFTVLDFKTEYRDKVVEYFFDEYQAGRTPNPDVMCNREIKFGLFYDWAMKAGFEYVATGHYAQLDSTAQPPALTQAVDDHKDQTYFLYRIRPEQLNHILFPIGHLKKSAVRTEAKKRHIPVADKKDSVGICFIGDINVHEFLKERLGKNPGQVVDKNGNLIGEHQGLWFYTIGQRHGFTIYPKTLIQQSDGTTIDKHNIPPFYVIGKKPAENQLVVGFGAEAYAQNFAVRDLHWLTEPEFKNGQVKLAVRIRHTGQLHPCVLTLKNDHAAEVQLIEPIAGIAEGQSAVFYSQGTCLGGGVIVSSL